VTEKLIRFSV